MLCFLDLWKVSSVISLFKNVGERSSSVISKLVNNTVFDRLEKCDLFSDFQYGFIRSR